MLAVIMMQMLVASSATGLQAQGRCAWGNATTGSIQGRNAAFHSGKSLEECKAACDANQACKSIDFSTTKGCFLGNCRIGKECKNSGDQDFTYMSCGGDPYWLDLPNMDSATASMISEAHGGNANRAIDGNAAASWHSRSVTHTRDHKNPWWKIDLGEKLDIEQVKVTNRGDCCGRHLNGFNVLVDDKECAKNVQIAQGQTVDVPCQAKGKEVKILIPRSRDHVMLAEVKIGVNAAYESTVTTTPAPNWLTPSSNWVASQVNEAHGGKPSRAIDGNAASSWHSRSVTHTHRVNDAWWKVDLKQKVNMSVVEVTNRGDCCGEWMSGGHGGSGFSVLVGDSDSTLKECATKVKIRQGQTKKVKCQAQGSIVKLSIPGRRRAYLMIAELRIGTPGTPSPPPPKEAPKETQAAAAAPEEALKMPSKKCTSSPGVCDKGGVFAYMVQTASESDCKKHCDTGREMGKQGGVLEDVYMFRQRGRFYDVKDKSPYLSRVVGNIKYSSTGSYWKNFDVRDHFYVRWSGFIKIATAGEYTFYTESDDGSRLFVNGDQIVDNPGWHGMRTKEGKAILESGDHEFSSEMFEGGGGAGMIMYYKGPDTGNAKVVMPQSAFQPPKSLDSDPDSCDWQCYMDRYPDVGKSRRRASKHRAAQHYHDHGKKAKRDCTCSKPAGEAPAKKAAGGLVIVSDAWKSGICQAYSYGAGSCLLYSKCDAVSKDADDVCEDKGLSGESGGLFGEDLTGFKTCQYSNGNSGGGNSSTF